VYFKRGQNAQEAITAIAAAIVLTSAIAHGIVTVEPQ
jgi:hypothetical protein